MPPKTVAQVLDSTARQFGDSPALKVKRGGVWETITWREYREQALRVARALVALGVEPRQGVAIVGFNAPEWVLADVGAILAGAYPAGIYTTSSAEQCQYVAAHCDAAVVFVDDADQAKKILS